MDPEEAERRLNKSLERMRSHCKRLALAGGMRVSALADEKAFGGAMTVRMRSIFQIFARGRRPG